MPSPHRSPAELRGGVGFTVIGDSIAVGGTSGRGLLQNHHRNSWFSYAALLSGGRLLPVRNAGASGDNMPKILNRLDRDVIAYEPDRCIVAVGRNDAALLLTPLSVFKNQYAELVYRLVDGNVEPILATIPASNESVAGGRAMIDKYNNFIRQYALTSGLNLLDFFAITVDPTTGVYKAAFSTDGVNPVEAGARAMGQHVVDTLVPKMPLWTPPLCLHSQSFSNNLLSNALFLASTSGLGTSWTRSAVWAEVTLSVVAGVGSEVGNWQRLTYVGPTSRQDYVYQEFFAPSLNPGDYYYFGGKVQSSVVAGGGTGGAQIIHYDNKGVSLGSITPFDYIGTDDGASTPSSVFQQISRVPDGTVLTRVFLILRGGTVAANTGGWVQFAQPTLINLTAQGI